MTAQLLLPFVLLAVGLVVARARSRKTAATLRPALRAFLQRTGYRYADVPSAELEDHAARGEEVFKNLGRGYQARLIRDYHGVPVHNVQVGQVTHDGWAVDYSWLVPLAGRPRVRLQVADRSLAGVGKAVKEAFSSTRRQWEPRYPQEVRLGDPELARRFVCFADDPAAAHAALAAPGLKPLLLAAAEVDLVVSDTEVRFADPFQKNLNAGLGGTVGMMSMGGDVAKIMALQVAVHDQIAELLAVTARAVS